MMEIPKQLHNTEIKLVLLGKDERAKIPFEKNWQTNGYCFSNPKLTLHISQGNNFGVIGGYGRVRILDIDEPKLAEEFEKKIETYTVKTGSGGRHFYFYSDYDTNHVLVNKLGELRAKNYQVVSAPCKHPNGNYYQIIKDVPIQEIETEELLELIKPYLRQEETKTLTNINPMKDTSRSGLEYREVLKRIGQGKTKEDIFTEMTAFAKWSEALEQYKERTYTKAKQYSENNIKEASQVFIPKGQAKIFNGIQPLFYDKNGLWWLWNTLEFKWQIVDEVDILNMITESTGEDIITPKNRTIILNSLKQEGRKHIPKPIKETWIQFKDTIIDILTGERFTATSEYFATNPLPWSLHEGNLEATPIMDKIFEEWVGKEHKKCLYEILAYCMLPNYPINRMFCFIGAGMNGKSKYLELLRNFIGGENCCTTELDTLLVSRFEITRLHKKLVCIMGETNFNEMTKTSIIKKLTGGDLIGFEYKNKNPFDEKNYAKILIATNNLPTTTDKTEGFYRRWMIIDFPNRFSEKKDILLDIPEEEYSSLALKCCSILKDILNSRTFTNEGTVEQRMERYEAKSNFFEKFLKETTTTDFNGYITCADLFKKFQAWCKEHRHRELSEVSVGMAMKKLGHEQEKKYFNWLYDGKGGQLRCWLNIKWDN